MEPLRDRAESANGRAHGRRQALLLGLLAATVAVLVLATHWPVLSAQAFSFDDKDAITENHLIQNPSWTAVGRLFGEIVQPSTVRGYYRPLTQISLMLDWAMGGRPENLRPFHRTSLALHVVNTVIVILILQQLFGQPWVAAMVGLLFGLHPLTVEPIAWVMERKTLLAAFFSFGCLASYLRYVRRGGWRWYSASLLAYVLGLMSKPTGTPLPLMMLLLDCWPLRRWSRRAVLEKLPFLLTAAVGALITYLCEDRVQDLEVLGPGSLTQLPLRICYLIPFYISKIVWPVQLSSAYSLPEPLALTNPVVAWAVAATGVLAAGVLISLRWTPVLLVGGLIFFLGIAPTLGLVKYSWVVASDKYVYLPAVGLLLLPAWLVGRLWTGASGAPPPRRMRVVTLVCVLGLAALEAAGTRQYLKVWRDTEGLARYMLDLAPNIATLHSHLGNALVEKGKADEAVPHYRRAIELDPGFANPYYNLAGVLRAQGKTDEAIQYLREAIHVEPGMPAALNNLGLFLAERGRFDEAIEQYRQILRVEPRYPEAHNNLGIALREQGKTDEAIACFRQALRFRPDYPDAHNNLGSALAARNKLNEAVEHYREAVRLAPDHAKAHRNLALALTKLGRAEEALPHYAAVARIEPRDPQAHSDLAGVLLMQGKVDEAVRHYAEAVELKPDSLTALNNLAWLLATREGQEPDARARAVELAERACRLTGHEQAKFLDTLAAAYAGAGRYPEAVRTAQKAVDLASASQQHDLAAEIRTRLELYKAGRPYRETSAASAPSAQ